MLDDFKLSEDVVILEKPHYKDEHLLQAMKDHTYCNTAITATTDYLKKLSLLIDNANSAKEWFKDPANADEKINDISKQLILEQMRYVILGKHILPRIAVMKYFLAMIDTNPRTVDEYKSFYGIYYFCIIFTLQGKKELPVIATAINADDWHEKLLEKAVEILESPYKSLDDVSVDKPEDDNNAYLARAVATLYNYFNYDNSTKKLKISNGNKALRFLTDKFEYSLEHFIINKKGRISASGTTTNLKTWSYPKLVLSKNSILNFIFLKDDVNGALGNMDIAAKLEYLAKPEINATITCEYSKKVIEYVKTYFSAPTIIGLSEDDQKTTLTEYFDKITKDEIIENYSRHIIKELKAKIKS